MPHCPRPICSARTVRRLCTPFHVTCATPLGPPTNHHYRQYQHHHPQSTPAAVLLSSVRCTGRVEGGKVGLSGGGGCGCCCCCCEWRLGESGLMFVCYWIALLGCRLGEGATHREKERERERTCQSVRSFIRELWRQHRRLSTRLTIHSYESWTWRKLASTGSLFSLVGFSSVTLVASE